MELLLNTIWAIVAIAGLTSAYRSRRISPARVRARLFAIAMVVIVLFPAISITDDLWAAQNPSEEAAWPRRHDHTAQPHTAFQEHAPALLTSIFETPGLVFRGHAPLPPRATPLPPDAPIFLPSIRPPPSV